MQAAVAGSRVVRTVGIVEAFYRVVRNVSQEGCQVIPNEGCDTAQLKAARTVVDDTAQQRKKNILRNRCSVDSGISSHRSHSRVGQAVNQSKDHPAYAQLPDGVVISISINRLQCREN